MSNKQYSSAEWLYHKIVIKLCNDSQTIKYAHLFKQELEQAKAMHKEEIIEAYETGSDTCYDLNLPSNGEQYYNQRYNK